MAISLPVGSQSYHVATTENILRLSLASVVGSENRAATKEFPRQDERTTKVSAWTGYVPPLASTNAMLPNLRTPRLRDTNPTTAKAATHQDCQRNSIFTPAPGIIATATASCGSELERCPRRQACFLTAIDMGPIHSTC